MPKFLIELLTAPHFADDAEKTRRAELLHIFSWTTVVLVLFCVLAIAVIGGQTVAAVAMLSVVIPLHGVALWLMHRGRVKFSSWLYCVVLFVALFTCAAFDPHARRLALDSLVLVVMAAGLLLSFGIGWVMAMASALVNAVLWHAVTRDILPGPLIERDFFSFVVVHFVLVSAALFVLFMATKSLERASEARIAHRLEIERPVSQTSANSTSERERMEQLLRVSLREKELLLQEVHHRVNNNMQIINSLLHIQASQASNDAARAALRQSQDRIRSMALVHEKLYRSVDLDKIYVGAYVRSLISHLFQSYRVDSEEIDLHLDIADDVVLSITLAIPCGLILTELLSNALRHAFPPAWSRLQERACIRVALTSADGRQVLIVSDNGIGLSTEAYSEEATSVGLQLVKLWVDQIDGNLCVEHTNGTTVRIVFTNSG